MAVYSAYLPPISSNRNPQEEFILLRDGKSPLALIAPPIWLAWNRLWLPLLVYAVVTFAIILLAFWQPGAPVAYLSALPGLYLLLEGSELVHVRHEREGWRFAGIFEGETKEEAEIRFIDSYDANAFDPKLVPVALAKPRQPYRSVTAQPSGLFPE